MKINLPQWLILAAVISLIFVVPGCSIVYHHYPFKEKRDIRAIETRLQQAISNSDQMKMKVVGQVTYNEQSLPVWLVTYSNSTHPKYHAFVSAGIHGNEPAGVEAVVSLIEEISQYEKQLPLLQIEFMPLLNPWAWVRDLKWNGDATDVNRKFISMDTQESAIIKQVIDKQRYDITIDLHEDGRYDGFYSLTYDNADMKSATELASTIAQNGTPLREFKGNKGFIHVAREEFADLSLPTLAFYCRSHVTEKAYILETPFHSMFENRTALHKTGILYLIGETVK